MTSAFRITRFPNFSPDTQTNLPPFAVWPAFPTADYYGGSVAMRVAPFRPSRVPPTVDVTGWFRRPFRVLEAARGSPVEALECSGTGMVEPEPSVCFPLSWRISGFRATSGYNRPSRPAEFQIGHLG